MKRVLLSNAKKVQELLDSVQNERMTRTIDLSDITYGLNEFVSFVGLPKTKLTCAFSFNYHAQRFPSSYRFKPMGTVVCLELIKGKPYITDVYRSNCNKGHRFDVFRIDDSMKQAMIDRVAAF